MLKASRTRRGGQNRAHSRRKLLACFVLVTLLSVSSTPISPAPGARAISRLGIRKIKHIIIIVQENRSFDHYFGTYPGANGIPRRPDGKITDCNPHPILKKCLKPYRTSEDLNIGGPHGRTASVRDVHGGKMDGYIRSAWKSREGKFCVEKPFAKSCKKFVGPKGQPDAMSFRRREDIPNYWAYADEFVLQDRMFASVDSFSLPAKMYLMSGWAAKCSNPNDPMSCTSDPYQDTGPPYAWTDITYLLDQNNISWAYYVGDGTNICPQFPDCTPFDKATSTPFNWNPVPGFKTVQDNDQVDRVIGVSNFLDGLPTGDIPQVSWITPGERVSEHPGKGSMEPGPAYVTRLINAIGESPVWDDSAIFLTWDDWGGFYDHVNPPKIGDGMGYGIRVPGLVIGPYAKEGYIDHQTLSFDAYLKLIEDVFLGSQRIDPATIDRPDSRPLVREEVAILGDLSDSFDFGQTPRPPLILDPTAGS
ncbi:MAG: alkaline phosphatase family protein [Actinomycetota bacterium]